MEERYYRGDTDEPKTKRSKRVLPLGHLVEAYRRHKPAGAGPEQYVFHDKGEPLDDRKVLRDVIRPAAKKLGVLLPGVRVPQFPPPES